MKVLGDCERDLTHTRQIECKAYRRTDGLWEIDARVTDEKAEEVPFRSRSPVRAGELMHRMELRFLIDREYTILDVQAHTQTAPWPVCGETDADYRALIGLRIGPGLRGRVAERLGGERGCTHLNDLITQVGNTYMQASWPERVARQFALDADPRRWTDQRVVGFVGQCHAWRREGQVLRREYPELADPGGDA